MLRDLEGQATRVVSNSDLSFHALRDYQPGDDRRHIHWKTTAKTGTLMVRQFEDTRRTHTAVALATEPDDYATEEEFELAVAAAASIGVQALRDERGLTFLAGPGCARRTPGGCSTTWHGCGPRRATGRAPSWCRGWPPRRRTPRWS